MQKMGRLMRVLAKLKERTRLKKKAKVVSQVDLLVQQLPVPVTLLEYMLGEWFRMVEEEEDEEVFYSYNMIIVNIDSKCRVSR